MLMPDSFRFCARGWMNSWREPLKSECGRILQGDLQTTTPGLERHAGPPRYRISANQRDQLMTNRKTWPIASLAALAAAMEIVVLSQSRPAFR